jgi:hypothetical protein
MKLFQRFSALVYWVVLGYFTLVVHSTVFTTEISIQTFKPNSVQSCAALGYDYFDSSLLSCANCPGRNQTASTSLFDGLGNSAGCECSPGTQYISNSNCLKV